MQKIDIRRPSVIKSSFCLNPFILTFTEFSKIQMEKINIAIIILSLCIAKIIANRCSSNDISTAFLRMRNLM